MAVKRKKDLNVFSRIEVSVVVEDDRTIGTGISKEYMLQALSQTLISMLEQRNHRVNTCASPLRLNAVSILDFDQGHNWLNIEPASRK